MFTEIEIKLLPVDAASEEMLKKCIAEKMQITSKRIVHIDIIKRSIDARRKPVVLNLRLGVHLDEVERVDPLFIPDYKDVSGKEKVIVIGAGPAGLFAALRLIERGYCPVILERGKSIAERKKDLQALYRTGEVNEDSNFGFGEGGAGTFSDGKLFSRSKKRGNTRRILEILIHHGADENILIDAHPHIGTDKLGRVIGRIRETIERSGGEVYFNHRVTDLLIKDNTVQGVVAGGKDFQCCNVILATGHSARDIYYLLYDKGILLERKDFAVGLRVEHQQHDIDCIQYHSSEGRGSYLPAAEYGFVTNVEGRGVYSFCMCPGGVVVPAATGKEQQVVNGMSSSARNTVWANSAIVTSIGEKELELMKYEGILGGMKFQEELEREAWRNGGGKLNAPCQVLTDFIKGRSSNALPVTSYKAGVKNTNFREWLPESIYFRLKEGIKRFDQKAPGFLTEQAVLLGVESRTSSPLRIPRGVDNKEHIQIKGLYPCGEGAGYAGGIMSAALDGESCAENIF